jgi:hypothetical protein
MPRSVDAFSLRRFARDRCTDHSDQSYNVDAPELPRCDQPLQQIRLSGDKKVPGRRGGNVPEHTRGRQTAPVAIWLFARAVTIIGLEARHADRVSTPMSPYEKWPRGTPSHHRGLVDVRHSADEVSMVSPATPTSLDRQSKRVLVDSAEWRDRLEQLAEMRYAATISIPSEETSLGLNRAARHPST